MAVKLDTAGLDDLIRTLDGKIDDATRATALAVEGEAKVRIPVDTGAAKNSLNTRKISSKRYYVEDGVEYGIHLELGTSRMQAQPFLVPAVEKVEPQWIRLIREAFGE